MDDNSSPEGGVRILRMPSLESHPLPVHDALRWSVGLTPIKVPRTPSRTKILDGDGREHLLPSVRSIVRHFEELEAVSTDPDVDRAKRHAASRAIFTWAPSTPPSSPSSSPTMRPRSQSASSFAAPQPVASVRALPEFSPPRRQRSHTISVGSSSSFQRGADFRDSLHLPLAPRYAGALEPEHPDEVPIFPPPGSPEIGLAVPPDDAADGASRPPSDLSPRRIKVQHNFENEEVGAALSRLQVDRLQFGADVDALFRRCKEKLFDLFEALGNIEKSMRKDIPALMLHASDHVRRSCQALFRSVRCVLQADAALRQAHVYKHSVVMLKENLSELKDEMSRIYDESVAFWSGPCADPESRRYALNGRQPCEDLVFEMDMLAKML